MTTTGLLPDIGIELREGYAQIGDTNLHYVEAGDGPLIVLLHGFPEFLQDANPPYTPQEIERYVEAWSQPGAAAGMINYYRASVRQSQQEAVVKVRPISAPTLVIWGSAIPTSAPNSPSPTATMCPTSTASSAWPTRRTGSITTWLNASTDYSSTSSPPRHRHKRLGPAFGNVTRVIRNRTYQPRRSR
jgi:hypothetical protein